MARARRRVCRADTQDFVLVKFPEQFRWSSAPPPYNTKRGDPFGLFIIPPRNAKGRTLKVMSVDGEDTGWEHVSVSLMDEPMKCPSWDEMCIVKSLFWEDEEWVVQFHPAKSAYVQNHVGCLHLWRSIEGFQTPPRICV